VWLIKHRRRRNEISEHSSDYVSLIGPTVLRHIAAWQRGGLSQAEYCAQQAVNIRTFTARLSEYRKLPDATLAALVPIQVTRSKPLDATAIVLVHAQGHRLELSSSVPAGLGGRVITMPGLIDYPAQIWLAVAPVDMRRGLDGLSAIEQQSLGPLLY
jgi:hypothetical protein